MSSSSSKNPHSFSNQLLPDQDSLSSKTPEKPAQPPYRTRNFKATIDERKKLPEKYEILSKFFNSLDSAIRLLRLKGLASSFCNICPKIEYLTDRKFSYGHLAQLKFILPEAIEIKKVVVFDERTCCMKPDLYISFNFGVLDCQGNLETGSWNMHLRKLFRTRLSEFVSSDPEIDEVPKEQLPEPFNPSIQPAILSTNSTDEIPTRIVTGPSEEEKLGVSHFPHSFSRHFSKKGICRESEKTELAMQPFTQDSSNLNAGEATDTVLSNAEALPKASFHVKLPSNPTFSSPHPLPALPLPGTPRKIMTEDEDGLSAKPNDIDSTPAKLVSTPVRLMVNTPAIIPPERSFMSPEDDSICSPDKLVRHSSRSRSLIFNSPTKKQQNDNEVDDAWTRSLDDI